MLQEFRILVAHDDAKLAREIAERLRQSFPDMVVITSDDPSGYGYDFDVFVLDCRSRGADELRLLRAEAPTSLFLAFVDGLDRNTLKRLTNAGIDGLFDGAETDELDDLLSRVRTRVTEDREAPDTGGVLGVMRSMTDLVRQWNRRLDRLEVS